MNVSCTVQDNMTSCQGIINKKFVNLEIYDTGQYLSCEWKFIAG